MTRRAEESRPMNLSVKWQTFAALSTSDLYAALSLRQAVFIVEQNCAFLDADGLDAVAIHGIGRDETGAVVAVARILPPGTKHPLPSIGRIAVARNARGAGYGRAIVADALAEAQRRYGGSPIWIEAQLYLEKFYASFGFARAGAPFDEDGIPHISMRRG
jgi:ElaA protein